MASKRKLTIQLIIEQKVVVADQKEVWDRSKGLTYSAAGWS